LTHGERLRLYLAPQVSCTGLPRLLSPAYCLIVTPRLQYRDNAHPTTAYRANLDCIGNARSLIRTPGLGPIKLRGGMGKPGFDRGIAWGARRRNAVRSSRSCVANECDESSHDCRSCSSVSARVPRNKAMRCGTGNLVESLAKKHSRNWQFQCFNLCSNYRETS
jgi:hypothetical protein